MGEPVRAPLRPAGWFIACPGCGQDVHILDTREDNAGAIHPLDEDRFFACDACGIEIEVVPVQVREVRAS